MSNHTPEPWGTTKGNGIHLTLANGEGHWFPIVYSKNGMDVAYIVPMEDTKHADADRIVACVNACAGINPEAVPDMLHLARLVANLNENHLEIGAGRMLEMVTAARNALTKAEANQ
jgi:hypothetical protein